MKIQLVNSTTNEKTATDNSTTNKITATDNSTTNEKTATDNSTTNEKQLQITLQPMRKNLQTMKELEISLRKVTLNIYE